MEILDKPSKGGRPSKYKPEYCQQVIDFLSKGYSLEAFASQIEVHIDTLYEWQIKHEEFSEAVNIGRSKCRFFWETAGIHGTFGKIPGFNASTFIFNMKNRFGWKDQIQHSGAIELDGTKEKIKEALLDPKFQDAIALLAEGQIETIYGE